MSITLAEELKLMLLEIHQMEKMAEDNCGKVLQKLKENGFYRTVSEIKNDEKEHQRIVQKLIETLEKR